MVNEKKIVLISDRGLSKSSQTFVEHPPIMASKIKSYITSIKNVRKRLLDTYPGCKFAFQEVDEFGKLLREYL